MYDYPFWQQAIPLVMVYFVWYAIVLRPGRRTEAKRYASVMALVGGERVLTASGLVGTVASIENGEYRIEVCPGTVVTVLQEGIREISHAAVILVPPETSDIPESAASPSASVDPVAAT